MQDLASAGGICIAGGTYDWVESNLALDHESLGAYTVKNIAQPVRVIEVLPCRGTFAVEDDRPLSLE